MFGGGSTTTNTFGQPSNSPFGSQSVFAQTSNAANNPFAPKPFGSTAPFGLQTGSSLFGGTSTGVFGATLTSSPFAATPAFNASSSPAFGASTPAFGASSAPAFGSSSSSFGGSSVFGQKPVFGGFGSTTQTSPFGSTSQQSQPGFGSSLFGSTTPFGASSHSAFGASSTPVFGSTSATAFGATTAPAFGASSTLAFGAASTPAYGATTGQAFGATATPAFGSSGTAFAASGTPIFGSGGAFGASSTSLFGSSSTSAFGSLSSPAFGVSSAYAFRPSSSPAFGASSTPAFGASSTPSVSFASSPAFSQSTSAFGSSSPGTISSLVGGNCYPFAFGAQRSGSRVTAYKATIETDSTGVQGQPGKLESISAMHDFKEKSHEELRWGDYQVGDKGGTLPLGQPSAGVGFTTPAVSSNPLTSQPSFSQSSPTQFSASTTNLKPFAANSTAFAVSTAPALNISPLGTSSPLRPSTSIVPTTFSPFRGTVSSSSTAVFGTAAPPSISSGVPESASPLSGIFGCTQQPSSFPSITPLPRQTGSTFSNGTTSSFQPTSLLGTPSTGIPAGIFPSTPPLVLVPSCTPTFSQTTSSAFQLTQPRQSTGPFTFSDTGLGQPAAAGTTGVVSVPVDFLQTKPGKPSATQGPVDVQPMPVTSPFGTLPVMPQMPIVRAGTSLSVQYGISHMPVVDKPAPVRISSLLTSRHLLQRRIRLPARKYYPKHDGPKVPFFNDEEETPSSLKAAAFVIPRENPRTLVVRPTEQLTLRANREKTSPLKDADGNGKILEATDAPPLIGSDEKDENPVENGIVKEQTHNFKFNQQPNGVQENHSIEKEESYVTISGHRAGEAAVVYEHGADIEAQMPELCLSDYYTEPRIQELAAKERAGPGFCRHVKDFVVGRHGFGSIKFVGETDVRRLDLESLVQFNNREVIVYMDESKKPPVGQGLNKPAEVTLLDIKCFDRNVQYTERPRIEKYKEMLKRKAEDQGAEFVSYDPVKGEWKFKVSHFSKYQLGDDEELSWGTQTAGVC